MDYELHRYLWEEVYSSHHLSASHPVTPFANRNFLTRSVSPFHLCLGTNVNLPFLVWTVFHGGLFQCSGLMSLGSLDFACLIGNPVEHYSWGFCFLKAFWAVFTW